jgi:hypothetical protein
MDSARFQWGELADMAQRMIELRVVWSDDEGDLMRRHTSFIHISIHIARLD